MGRELTVRYRTADGTAKAGRDYAMAVGSVVFAPGDTVKTIVATERLGASHGLPRRCGGGLIEGEATSSSDRHQVVVAGPFASGPLLEVFVPPGSRAADHRVEILEVAAEDYGLRNLWGYSIRIPGPPDDAVRWDGRR